MKSPIAPKAASERTPSSVTVDQKYESYSHLHSNLDGLIWNNQATLLGITVLGMGAIGVVREKELSFGPFDTSQTLGAILFFLGLLYVVTIFTQARMAYWHDKVEGELRKLEPDGYFHLRHGRASWLSARRWNSIVFGGFAVAAFVGAAYFELFER